MVVDYILSQVSFSRPYFVIGIDGPTAVGKSYLADMLAERLNEQKIHHFIFRLDWTLINRDLRENEIDLFVKKNSPFEYEASLHMDLSRASQFLADLQNNFTEGEIHQLKGLYNRDDDGRCTGKVEFVMEKNMVVIVEGHYTHHKSLCKYFDYNVLLLSKPEELLRRKIIRAGDYRDENLIKSYFKHIDVPSFVHYLESVHNSVSCIFDNTDYTKPKEFLNTKCFLLGR